MGSLASPALRVGVVGPLYADSFADNIADELSEMGVATESFDPRSIFARGNVRRRFVDVGRSLVEEVIRRNEPLTRAAVDAPLGRRLTRFDPTVVISTYGYLSPWQLERLRAVTPRATWVLWFPDALANLANQLPLTAPWDHVFFKDPYLVDMLSSRAGVAARFLPEACNPRRHFREVPATGEERRRYGCDVCVAGNLYPYRARMLTALPADINLRLYGNLSRTVRDRRLMEAYSGEYVSGRSKRLAFGGAAVVLNTLHYSEIRSVNARLFEATACGAFVVTHATPGLNGLYVAGSEVVAVDSLTEMIDAVRHYVAHPEERNLIATAGYRRAHDAHTYRERLRTMLRICGAVD